MENFSFDLVTPEAVFFSGKVISVEAPGSEGDFGIFPGHEAFVSTLRPGIVTVYGEGDRQKRIFVASGIAEANGDSCSILAENIVDLDNFSRQDAETRLEKAKDILENTFEEVAKEDAAHEVKIAEALLAAIEA